MKKVITLEVNGKELQFNVTTAAYNKYLNSLTATNKVQPSHNFCMATVTDESKEALKEFLSQPGAAVTIAGYVVEDYQPEFEITVKK